MKKTLTHAHSHDICDVARSKKIFQKILLKYKSCSLAPVRQKHLKEHLQCENLRDVQDLYDNFYESHLAVITVSRGFWCMGHAEGITAIWGLWYLENTKTGTLKSIGLRCIGDLDS